MIERFSASVASKHVTCHASANLEKAIPGWTPPPNDGDTKASVRGSELHSVMEMLLAATTPKEMRQVAQAVEYVADLRSTRRFKMLVEAEGNGWWLTGDPKTRVDLVLHTADELHIVDWKFGKIPVSAVDNAQLMYYALAFAPLAPKAKVVTLHIVQPFANNLDSWTVTAAELEAFRLKMVQADTAIQGGSVKFTPSDHCMFCPANPHTRGGKGTPKCPAMMKLLYPEQFDIDGMLEALESS